jgi:hypothetical protein
MKKLIVILVDVLSLCTGTVQAQIPNPGFEKLDSEGHVTNWGKMYLFIIEVEIDSNGEVHYHSDSILYDTGFYFPTSDAHSGERAMEMRNAYNVTRGIGIAGSVIMSANDSVYDGFSSPVTIHEQPISFNFYYKYFPVNNDSAIASMTLFDAEGNTIGEATTLLYDTTDTYTLASVPVVYTRDAQVASASMYFSTSNYNPMPSYGTRLIVDDVFLTSSTGFNGPKAVNINLYPNPASHSFHIGGDGELRSVMIRNLLGKEVLNMQSNSSHIDCSSLAEGLYMVTVQTAEGIGSAKLVIRK